MAALKLRSKDPKMNEVIRELALDLAEGKFEIDFFQHLPGKHNIVDDALSRCYEPGASQAMPAILANASRSFPSARTPAWWETAAEPGAPREDEERQLQPQCPPLQSHHGHGARGDHRRVSRAVGRLWDILRGGGGQDVPAQAARAELMEQLMLTAFAWWAPECRSFSRIRGKPIPGEKAWPKA